MEDCQKYSVLVDGYKWYPGHLADYIRNLKKVNPLVDITLTTSRPLTEFPKDICDNTKEIVQIPTYSGRIKNNAVCKAIESFLYAKVFAFLSFKNKFDIVNIHYPSPRVFHAIPWMKRMSDHIVLTPWGSDVLRAKKSEIRRMCKIYDAADYVTVDPDSQLCIEVITKFSCKATKILPFIWGMEYVDYLREMTPTDTVEESKERFGLKGRYVITCGYNSRLAQRHKAIICAVSRIKDKLPNNLTLLFPFTYGKLTREGYDQELLALCKENRLDGMVINDFLTYPDLYKLRNATDMFVHVQTTDAASACVMQYILCHKKIVHGSWMRYNDLEEYKPLFYFPVNHIEELGQVILSAYQSDPIKISPKLIDSIMDRGWSRTMKELNARFESVLT